LQREHAPGDVMTTFHPMLEDKEGRLVARLSHFQVKNGHKIAGVEIDPEGAAALEAFEAILNEPGMSARFRFEPGQMQLIDNRALGHKRTAFRDWPEPERKPKPQAPTEPPAPDITVPEAPSRGPVTEEVVLEDMSRTARPEQPPAAPLEAAGEQPEGGVAVTQPAMPDLPEHVLRQQRTLQAKNLYRAGVSFYRRQNYEKARDLFEQTAAASPKSVEAANALKYLGNIDVAMGKGTDKASGERSLKATAKAIQLTQQAANVDLRQRQQDLLRQAREAKRRGDEQQAESAYRVAVNVSGTLQKRGEEAREQEAVVREAEAFLNARREAREQTAREIKELKSALGELKKSYASLSGKRVDDYAGNLAIGKKLLKGKEYRDALKALQLAQDLPDVTAELRRGRAPPEGHAYTDSYADGIDSVAEPTQAARQVEVGEALAEQQVTLTGAGVVPQFGNQAPRFDVGVAGPESDERTRDAIRREFDDLTSAYKKLASRRWGGTAVEGAKVAKPDHAASLDLHLGTQVARHAERLQAEARRVTTLAREGRIAEAERLADRLEREAHRTAAAAGVLRGKESGPTPRGRPEGEGEVVTGLGYGAFRPEKPAPGTGHYLRYPDATEWGRLADARRDFAKAVAPGQTAAAAPSGTKDELAEVR
ncbi:MAG: TauD/TfdA family dioxygenase, partial [Planctomycetota bacterium]|nr:TauD/TfdA family dioxygenase [Planctomycetota bacterium]